MNIDRVVMVLCEGTGRHVAEQLRAMADRVEQGDEMNIAGNPRVTCRRIGDEHAPQEEPTYGRFYGVFADCEGAQPPIALFSDKEDAETYAGGGVVKHEGCRGDYGVCRVDMVGSMWNSYAPDPHDEVAT